MDPLEETSQRLLNGYRRLELASVIAGLPETFRTAEVVERAGGMTPTDVSKELRHFLDCGVLEKLKHGSYRRLHHEFWLGCASIRASTASAPIQLRAVDRQRSGR